MKSTVVDESLSYYKNQCTVPENTSKVFKILNFGYRINYKYEGMLTRSFERFYMITKFMLPSKEDLKFSKLNYDNTYAYLDNKKHP